MVLCSKLSKNEKIKWIKLLSQTGLSTLFDDTDNESSSIPNLLLNSNFQKSTPLRSPFKTPLFSHYKSWTTIKDEIP
jgi:hypothetical protein